MIIIINDVMQWIMHTLICFFNLSVKYETVSATTQEKKHEITPMYPDSSSFTPKGLKLRVITAFVKRKVIFLNPHDNYYTKYILSPFFNREDWVSQFDTIQYIYLPKLDT